MESSLNFQDPSLKKVAPRKGIIGRKVKNFGNGNYLKLTLVKEVPKKGKRGEELSNFPL